MSIIQKFKNDYNQTCHPALLHALQATSESQFDGYGLDTISQRTEQHLRNLCQCQGAQVHFLSAGTQTNLLCISAFLRPHQAVIAAESGHINVHETGAIEATGHKVLTAKSDDGKLRPEDIEALVAEHDNEHMVQAKMVYISQATELGSVYTKQEFIALAETCKKLDLYLFVDGARLGAALTCPLIAQEDHLSLAHLAQYADAFYIGGTKNGALFGEALVLVNTHVQKDFRYLCKQRGAMLAKGWLVAAQFEALFQHAPHSQSEYQEQQEQMEHEAQQNTLHVQNSLYASLAKHGNEVAQYIDTQLSAMGIPLFAPTVTNQIFPILPVAVVEELSKSYAFEIWARGTQQHTIRFVTSWGIHKDDANALLSTLKTALANA